MLFFLMSLPIVFSYNTANPDIPPPITTTTVPQNSIFNIPLIYIVIGVIMAIVIVVGIILFLRWY